MGRAEQNLSEETLTINFEIQRIKMSQGIILILVTLCIIGNSAKRTDPTRFDSGKNPILTHVHREDPTRFDSGKKQLLAPIRRDPTRFDSGKNPLLAPIRRGGSVLGSLVGDVKCQATEFSSNLKLQDDNFVRQQLQCILNQGPCDKIGNTFKRMAPEVLRGRCPPPCDKCMKKQIQKAMSVISRKYPREWTEMLKQQLGR